MKRHSAKTIKLALDTYDATQNLAAAARAAGVHRHSVREWVKARDERAVKEQSRG